MKKQFLVTVSSDTESLYGVRFLCHFYTSLSRHTLTLLHINRLDIGDMRKSMLASWKDPATRELDNLSPGTRRVLEKSKQLLARSQMDIKEVKTHIATERYGKVKDILNEGERGLYDAIILGKRAGYTLQWVFERPAEETPLALIKDRCCTSPIWICPDPGELEKKDVLICVDGSDGAMRAVDHAGYILSEQKHHKPILFHVATGTGPAEPEVFSKAIRVLEGHGIDSDRIVTESEWGLNVPGAILSRAEKRSVSAVCAGLHGVRESVLKDLHLTGGTAGKLIAKISNTTLWCCP